MPFAPKRHQACNPQPGAAVVRNHSSDTRDQFPSSRRWIRLRDVVRREEPLCRNPLGLHAPGETVPTEEIDHIIPRRERPDLALVRSNLRGLCKRCHSSVTALAQRPRAAGSS